MSLDSKGRVTLLRAKWPKWRADCTYSAVTKSLPFVQSAAGIYTHRVRSITVINGPSGCVLVEGGDWLRVSASCWCGHIIAIHSNMKSRRRPLGLLLAEPADRPVCATCEGRAIGAGQLGAPEIAGRIVMYSPRRQIGD